MVDDFITIREIQEIVDRQYKYGTEEPEDIIYMEEVGEEQKHLLSRQLFFKYLKMYAEEHGYEEYTEIIRTMGRKKGMTYYKDDIKDFLDDPSVDIRLNDLYESKTRRFMDRMVPKCIYSKLLNDLYEGDEDDKCIEMTGYNKHALALLNEDDDELLNGYWKVTDKIEVMEYKLAELRNERNDYIEIMRERGMRVKRKKSKR